ncbi:ArnT family glycosyltransferase [Asticcacaulis endophyticus]|uniref:Glucosyltransferase n=1 Tax=Asticcacaulis endophyticus TaxID=1395890 RepID=A0A918Q2V0_9CAUL|nr:glycosyltransferase family 39 protein [Asticcacaulis endophyticus]GGZ29873.1 glucosyltransferase [Asticcacaulis endophyticus]
MSSKLIAAATQGLRGPLLAALVAFLVGLPCALIIPPLDRDESRFVQASSQMLESRDFININYQDGPRHKKPVGIHWLQAASVSLTSEVGAREILAYRWPSLLGAALAAFSLAWGGGALFDNRRGLKAGLILGISLLLSTEAFIAKTDAVLCGFVTLFMAALAQIYVAYRNRPVDADPKARLKLGHLRLTFWLAFAASILIKGPIGPMIFLATAFTLIAWDKQAAKGDMSKGNMDWFRHLGWSWGIALTVLMVGPWAIAITIATDGAFWGTAIGDDLAPKLVSGSEGHFAWPGTHTLMLPLMFFPGTFLLGGALQAAISRRIEPAIRFAICWFLPAFIIFEISPTKLIHYPLPAYGGLALLAAVSIGMVHKRWAKIMNMVLGLFAGVVISWIAITALTEFGTGAHPTVALTAVTLTVASALLIAALGGFFLWKNHKAAGLLCLFLGGVGGHLGLITLASQLKPLWMSVNLENTLIETRTDPRLGLIPGPVATLGYAEPSFVFAMGTKTALLDNAQQAVTVVEQGRPIFVEAEHLKAFEAEMAKNNLKVRAITTVHGHNYSNGNEVAITLFRKQ